MRCFTPSSIRSSRPVLVLAAAILIAGLATPARADFTGPYSVLPAPSSFYDQSGEPNAPFGHWVLSGTDYHFFALEIDTSPTAVTLNTGYAEDDGGGDYINLRFQVTSAGDGPLSFNYQLSLANTDDDSAAYSINGVITQLPAGSNSVSGVPLEAGDVFAFSVTAGPQELAKGIMSDTVLTVTNFAAPVPEPSSLRWLAAVGGMALVERCRRCWLAQHAVRTALVVIAWVAAGFLATPVRADFSGPYALTPPVGRAYPYRFAGSVGYWTLVENATDDFPLPAFSTVNAPDSFSLNTGEPDDNNYNAGITMELTTAAANSGPLTFAYNISEGGNDRAGYSINGVDTYLPAGRGTVRGVTLGAGDTFGFFAEAGAQAVTEGIHSYSELVVSNFVAPVPEPSVYGWLALGLAVYGGWGLATPGAGVGR